MHKYIITLVYKPFDDEQIIHVIAVDKKINKKQAIQVFSKEILKSYKKSTIKDLCKYYDCKYNELPKFLIGDNKDFTLSMFKIPEDMVSFK